MVRQAGAAGPEAAASTDQLLASLKRELVVLLEPYQPQGLVCETLASEYTHVRPLVCSRMLTYAHVCSHMLTCADVC